MLGWKLFIVKTLGILRNSHRVLAAGISGSGARDKLDAFSDIDILCYLRDEERSGLHETLSKVADQAPLLCRMWLYKVNGLFLYEDGVRLDLDVHPQSALKPSFWMSLNESVLNIVERSILSTQKIV